MPVIKDVVSKFQRFYPNLTPKRVCSFIGEIISGGNLIKPAIHEYGDQHKNHLWEEFKNELCNSSNENWLYNAAVDDPIKFRQGGKYDQKE